MKLFVIYDYKSKYPELSGRALTDALIRDCLEEYMDEARTPQDFIITRTEKGKPLIRYPQQEGLDAASPDGVHISVSHSGGTFSLVAAEENVGLDIQYARAIDVNRIAARFFVKEEADSVAEDGTGERFFTLWTRKEAYSKYTGMGLEQITRNDTDPDRIPVQFYDFRLADGCFCSICIGEKGGCKADEIQISYRE